MPQERGGTLVSALFSKRGCILSRSKEKIKRKSGYFGKKQSRLVLNFFRIMSPGLPGVVIVIPTSDLIVIHMQKIGKAALPQPLSALRYEVRIAAVKQAGGAGAYGRG